MFYLDPQNAAFAAALEGQLNPHELGYADARVALESLQECEVASDIMVEKLEIPGPNGESTPVVIFRPENAPSKLPMIFYLHGGGWIMGSPTSFAPLMEDIARQCQAAVIFPYYTPAPEKQFPFQFEQTYTALDHFVRNGSAHGLLVETFALAGDSVGGHMAIAMMQMSIERNLPAKISQMILFNPVTDTQMKHESYETYKDGPFLPAASMDWMIDAFLPNESDRKTALASPLSFAPDEVLLKFPPTTIFVGDVDPLVDEGKAFGRRLQQLGMDAAVIQADGQMHAFILVGALRHSPTARAVMEFACLKMRKAFPTGLHQQNVGPMMGKI